MYLRDLWTSFLRRWYIALVCLLAGAGVLVLAAGAVKPTYQATASVVLVPPQSKDDPSLNRYMALGGLQESADVLARSLSSEETSTAINRAAPGAQYEVVTDDTTSAPILSVTVTSAGKASTEKMLDVVLTRIPRNLRSLQANLAIEPSNQITTVVLSSAKEPQLVQKTRMRILGALGAALVLASAVTVAALDGLLLRRAQRKRSGATDLEQEAVQEAAGQELGSREPELSHEAPSAAQRAIR